MTTYLVKFADGLEVEVDALSPANAQEEAIEYLDSIGAVVHEITSIARVAATPL